MLDSIKSATQTFFHLHTADDNNMVHPFILKTMAFALPSPPQVFVKVSWVEKEVGETTEREQEKVNNAKKNAPAGGLIQVCDPNTIVLHDRGRGRQGNFPSDHKDEEKEKKVGDNNGKKLNPHTSTIATAVDRFHCAGVFNSDLPNAHALFHPVVKPLADRVFNNREDAAVVIEGQSGSGKLNTYLGHRSKMFSSDGAPLSKGLAEMLANYFLTLIGSENMRMGGEKQGEKGRINNNPTSSSSSDFVYSLQCRFLQLSPDNSVKNLCTADDVKYQLLVQESGNGRPIVEPTSPHEGRGEGGRGVLHNCVVDWKPAKGASSVSAMLRTGGYDVLPVNPDGFVDVYSVDDVILLLHHVESSRRTKDRRYMNTVRLEGHLLTTFRIVRHTASWDEEKGSTHGNEKEAKEVEITDESVTAMAKKGEGERKDVNDPKNKAGGERKQKKTIVGSEGEMHLCVLAQRQPVVIASQSHVQKSTIALHLGLTTSQLSLEQSKLTIFLSRCLAGYAPLALVFLLEQTENDEFQDVAGTLRIAKAIVNRSLER